MANHDMPNHNIPNHDIPNHDISNHDISNHDIPSHHLVHGTAAQPSTWTATLERQPLVVVGLGVLAGFLLARLMGR